MRAALFALMLMFGVSAAWTGRFSDFLYFIAEPSLAGFYGDGFVFDGPFRANGPICIWSVSPGRSNDPWFYSLTLASPFYYCSPGGPSNPQTEPQYGNLWIEPYELMSQGPPWFVLDAEPIPFGADSVNWQEARDAAMSGGIYFAPGVLPSGTRLLLRGDSLLVKTSSYSPSSSYWLGGLQEQVVWIDNGPEDAAYLKGYPLSSLTIPLTIGMNGDLFMSGQLESDSLEGLLGIVCVHGNQVIADDPDIAGDPDWDPPWDIATDVDVEYAASLISCSGDIHAECYWKPYPAVYFLICGSWQAVDHGYTCSSYGGGGLAGFLLHFYYDWRLEKEAPPHYPSYETTGIADDPEASDPGLFLLSVCPCPFSETLLIGVEGAAGDDVSVSVFDASGRLVLETAVQNCSVIDGSSLPSGVLLVRASSSGMYATKTVVHLP